MKLDRRRQDHRYGGAVGLERQLPPHHLLGERIEAGLEQDREALEDLAASKVGGTGKLVVIDADGKVVKK